MTFDADDAGLYPQSWDEFVGQNRVKLQLQIAIQAAKKRKAPLEHVLLASATPGIGKSSLAQLVIRELGVNYRVQSGPVKPDDLLMLFLGMEDGDVLLLEELHKLADGGKSRSEWLLHYLQDGVLITPMGPEKVARCTVIGTTTDAGRLPSPVLQRFQIVPSLQPYSDLEGQQIALRLASKILVAEGLTPPSATCGAAIALASSNQPRIMKRLLINLRNLVLAGVVADAPDYDLTTSLEWSGLTADGLDDAAQRYLIAIFTNFGGRAAGRTVLSSLVGEVGTSLTDLERQLMDKGLIVLHNTAGRRLTRAGIERTDRLLKERVA